MINAKGIAKLARIHLDEEEETMLAKDLTRVLSWVGELSGLELADIRETEDKTMSLRKDIIDDIADKKKFLSNAPDGSDAFFMVPKILEG